MLFEHNILKLIFNNKNNLTLSEQNTLIENVFRKYNYISNKQNSGKFGEYLFEEYLKFKNINYEKQKKYTSIDKNIPSYIFDFVINDVAIEIKTNLYDSPGTAYEKIYSVPIKYRYIHRYGIKKMIIILMLDNENKIIFKNDKETNKWLNIFEHEGFEFKYFSNILIENIKPKQPIKWAGCKQNSINHILESINTINKNIDSYYEPFLGSGCVFINVVKSLNKIFKEYYVSDINVFIIKMFYLIEHNVNILINKLQEYELLYNKQTMDENKTLYNQYRDKFNKYIIDKIYNLDSIILFMFINKICYHGLYRVNNKGLFNVPFGNYENIKFDYNNLK